MAFISGGYTCTWNSLACGQSADGYRLTHQIFKRIITGDSYAEAPQDAVYRGAEVSVQWTMIDYTSAAIQTIKWPYNGTKWQLGTVGTLDVGSSLAKSLILTAVAGTPAAATPATATFALSIIHESFPVEVLFAPDLREIPMRMRVYPNNGLLGVET
jgi:hypothetical protein